jgi:hypothetical protein
MVLRDPPGGASSASIVQGTSATFDIGIDGIYTYHADDVSDMDTQIISSYQDGAKIQGVANKKTTIHSYDVERISHTHYAYTFNFHSTISTSLDPNIAGHASDVIVGGGVNLIANEALIGNQHLC